ncbi:hypothetical protein FPZ12_038425 [Amycolatopsis acidicola]|uniref:Uncharacterized protein n=1 Tax=Amycolatopsis acidicola TaxID=2596893 RepID=A0A5N0URI9_9PSEU|nr:hypothetical protein [Amycolatopsis acidicola]KAA9151724.1 hypothetical protein FPZ12_038425 [Amycolatopsis acidicola]
MLYIVLLLVLAALGLLVTALITATSLWAWVSIGLSVLAAIFLVIDFGRRRAQRKRAAKAEDTLVAAEPALEDEKPEESEEAAKEPAEDAEAEKTEAAEEEPAPAETTALLPAEGEVSEKEPAGDPAEEASDPADVELVSALESEVVVVDEYPRYHVPDCGWLADRDTIPIAVKEARELGFTPCARCTPDAKLAAEHRATTKS